MAVWFGTRAKDAWKRILRFLDVWKIPILIIFFYVVPVILAAHIWESKTVLPLKSETQNNRTVWEIDLEEFRKPTWENSINGILSVPLDFRYYDVCFENHNSSFIYPGNLSSPIEVVTSINFSDGKNFNLTSSEPLCIPASIDSSYTYTIMLIGSVDMEKTLGKEGARRIGISQITFSWTDNNSSSQFGCFLDGSSQSCVDVNSDIKVYAQSVKWERRIKEAIFVIAWIGVIYLLCSSVEYIHEKRKKHK